VAEPDDGRMIDGPFRGSAALATGLISPAVLRGPRFRRLFPDVYAPAALEPDLALRSRAAHVWLAGRGALAGYSAAELYGAHCAPPDAPAEVTVPARHRHAPAGLVAHQDRLADDEDRVHRGLRLTTPLRTAYDLARRLDLVDAVVALDALAGRFGFAPDEVLRLSARYPRARGRRGLSEVVAHAEPLAESAMESRLRMLLVLAGLPRPVAQHTVTDRRGLMVATVDLAYPAHRVAIEYQGGDHFTPERAIRDTRRITRLLDLGWRVYQYVARDVYRTPDRVVADVRRALAAPARVTA
jgi:very-short-patch-repair endonuclease